VQSKASPRQTERHPQGHSQETRPRRGFRTWIRRGLVWVSAGLLGLAVIGAFYQAVATEIDQRAYPPPGEMVDVGNHSLHINCIGKGSPTVILESGLGTMSADWANVQPRVAKTTRVCAYDRAGTGWSETGPEPRDPRQIAHELHTLLGNAGIDGPYVLVGQSFGGLYVRMYADLYPKEVAGIVLADSSHPDMWGRMPPEVVAMLRPPAWQVGAMTFLTRLGIFRLTASDMAECGLPVQQCKEEQAYLSSTRYRVTWGEEMLAPDRDAQVRSTGSLGDKPLVVLSAGDHRRDLAAGVSPATLARFERTWDDLQGELAALSTDSTHLVVERAGHSTLQTDRRDARVTSADIEEVIQAARTGRHCHGKYPAAANIGASTLNAPRCSAGSAVRVYGRKGTNRDGSRDHRGCTRRPRRGNGQALFPQEPP
jgi:pimeloyl-ACP methyl ester carboxylesterase